MIKGSILDLENFNAMIVLFLPQATVEDGLEGWVTTLGNAGTLYAEALQTFCLEGCRMMVGRPFARSVTRLLFILFQKSSASASKLPLALRQWELP